MSILKRAWSGIADYLSEPPEGARAWFIVIGAATLFVLLWGLLVAQAVMIIYSMKPPEMNWNIPSGVYLADEMFGALGETAVLQGVVLILAVILSGRKSVAMLTLLSVPLSIYYISGHVDRFAVFAGPNVAVLWAAVMHGVLFFCWCMLFVKCIDAKSTFQLKAFVAVSCSHFLYNIFINRLLAFCW